MLRVCWLTNYSPLRRHSRPLVLVLCCFNLFTLAIEWQSFAQQKGSQRREQESVALQPHDPVVDVLRFDIDLIAVDVRVTDRDGRPVRNLRPQDFKLFEDNSERPISFFNMERKDGEQQPVAVVFALDISGSMSVNELERLRAAMGVFSSWLAERPSAFAVTSFGMNVRVLQTFTSDLRKFDRAFARLVNEPGGLSTHTYDAVDDAIRMLNRKAPRTRNQKPMKRAVVVVTDGFPVGDTVAPQTVIERANAAEVSIYTITLPSFSRAIAGVGLAPLPTPLDVSGLVEQTGGVAVYATDEDLAPLMRALAAEVTSSYVLAFYPTDEKRRDGQFHTIRVEAPPGLSTRQSRPGYQGNLH
jgi:Ca-activated chloride channel family protein